MRRVVLITGHYLLSDRKAGFHWLADAYHRMGWDVTFFTAAFSRLSRLRRDHRLAYPILQHANRPVRVADRLTSFVWYTPYHPANLRLPLANRLSGPLFRRYPSLPLDSARPLLQPADLLIFESTPGIMLFDRLTRLAPHARTVYRVSDDLRVLNNHPVVLAAEDRLAPRFDLISVPGSHLLQRFEHLPQAHLHPHGLQKPLFDTPHPNPYTHLNDASPHPLLHAVYVGNARLDLPALHHAARLRRQWHFHLLGEINARTRRHADHAPPNLHRYGERPFHDLIPFLQHAHAGLHTLLPHPGVEVFAQSLKVLQYTYCRLPILAPRIMQPQLPHMIAYDPHATHPDSLPHALDAAATYPRDTIDTTDIASWDEVAQVLAQVSHAEPPALRSPHAHPPPPPSAGQPDRSR